MWVFSVEVFFGIFFQFVELNLIFIGFRFVSMRGRRCTNGLGAWPHTPWQCLTCTLFMASHDLKKNMHAPLNGEGKTKSQGMNDSHSDSVRYTSGCPAEQGKAF